MRPRDMTKTLLIATAVLGLTAGGAGGVGFAAPARPATVSSTASGTEVAPLAVVNLGLSVTQARKVQCFLERHWEYDGPRDGLLGTGSWQAMQRYLVRWGYEGRIDGVVGTGTVMALQRVLQRAWDYDGLIDGIPGDGTKAAFKRFAEDARVYC